MSVLKAQTTATPMLTVRTLLEVFSVHVVLVTLEMGSSPATVRKKYDINFTIFSLFQATTSMINLPEQNNIRPCSL